MSSDKDPGGLTVLCSAPIQAAKVNPIPYPHLVASGTIRKEAEEDLLADSPNIERAGSFALDDLAYGQCFARLIDDLSSAEFRSLVEDKFRIELSGCPTVFGIRGYSSLRGDGHVHPDLKDKVITVLLYLNRDWQHAGGRLRLLRARDLNDYAIEVPPLTGNMIIFRRSSNSWHGHLPYEGPRLMIQMNWVRSRRAVMREYWHRRMHVLFGALLGRHRASRRGAEV